MPNRILANPYLRFSANEIGTGKFMVAPSSNPIAVLESALGLVATSPVVVGSVASFGGKVGVVTTAAEATTDYPMVSFGPHGGVVLLSIKGEDGAGNAEVSYGERIYLDTDGEVNVDLTNGIAFGIYLGATITAGTTVVGPVLLIN